MLMKNSSTLRFVCVYLYWEKRQWEKRYAGYVAFHFMYGKGFSTCVSNFSWILEIVFICFMHFSTFFFLLLMQRKGRYRLYTSVVIYDEKKKNVVKIENLIENRLSGSGKRDRVRATPSIRKLVSKT